MVVGIWNKFMNKLTNKYFVLFGFLFSIILIYISALIDCWRYKDTIVVETQRVSSIDKDKITSYVETKELVLVTMKWSVGDNTNINFLGFPKNYLWGYTVLKIFKFKENSDINLIKKKAWDWVESKEGKEIIMEIRNRNYKIYDIDKEVEVKHEKYFNQPVLIEDQ